MNCVLIIIISDIIMSKIFKTENKIILRMLKNTYLFINNAKQVASEE